MKNPRPQRAPRVARSLIVRYRCVETGQTSWSASPLRDLSTGGIRFLSESMIKKDKTLELQLLLPNSEEPIRLRANVVWAKSTPSGFTELGAAFRIVDTPTQRVIEAAVAHFLKRQRS